MDKISQQTEKMIFLISSWILSDNKGRLPPVPSTFNNSKLSLVTLPLPCMFTTKDNQSI